MIAYPVLGAADGDGGPVVVQGLGINDSFGKWPNGTVTWVYNSTLAPDGFTDDNVTLQRMQAGLDEWERVCGVRFVSNGVDDSANIGDLNDGVVVVQWEDIAGAGLAGPAWNALQDRTGPGHFEYTDGTLRLDPATFALTGLNADQTTNRLIAFNQTFMHEIGHVLGLGHSSDHHSIMFANPYNSLDHVRNDDIDACRALYGYSSLFDSPDPFVPPSAGPDPTDILFLAPFSDPNMATTNDLDNTLTPFADGDTLAVRWQITQGGYSDTLTQTVVDPAGYRNIITSNNAVAPAGGAFGIASFGRLRELPGNWIVHVNDSNGLIASLVLDVTAAPPAEIENPGATISFSENPGTRATSVTVNVTSVSAAAVTPNQVTVDWHIGTVGNIQETLTVPGSSTRNFTFNDSLPHDVHIEVTDDQVRYNNDVPGGDVAGAGFQTLLPYFSSGLNLGPDGSGDNSSDILLVNPGTGEVFFWNMHGNLIDPRGPVAVLTDLNWSVAGRGDYDGDGKFDILWRNAVTQQLYIWFMDGSVILSAAPVAILSSGNWQIVGDGDYSGDGNSDILFRNTVTQQVYLWTMNGATITGAAQIAILQDPNWQVVGDKDFDGDGIADIMWYNNPGTGQVYFWRMNGSTIISAALVATVSDLAWEVVGDGDQNGDGRADLTWQRRGAGEDGKVYYWQMNGATIDSSSRISIVSDQDWSVVGTGDLNGDSRSDLVWFNSTSRQIYHWQQDGATTLRGGQISSALAPGWQIVDVN